MKIKRLSILSDNIDVVIDWNPLGKYESVFTVKNVSEDGGSLVFTWEMPKHFSALS